MGRLLKQGRGHFLPADRPSPGSGSSFSQNSSLRIGGSARQRPPTAIAAVLLRRGRTLPRREEAFRRVLLSRARRLAALWRAAGNVAGAYDVHQLTTTEPGVVVLPDGTLADETGYDTELGKHYKTSMDQDKAAAKGVGNRTSVPMRLHHYQLRSLAECTWKRTCANAQDTDGNHGDGGGWRGETECISNNGENDDESEVDMSAAVYVNATRATMLSLFGKGGLQLQSQLAAWWTQQMRAVTAGESA